MSVKVGVRVRPFNQREVDLNCRLCVEMMGATTRLFDVDEPEKHRDFTFDYSFWSHDRFTPNENGYFVYFIVKLVPTMINMQLSNKFSRVWDLKSSATLGKGITAACSRMVKQGPENRIRWSGTVRIK